jgi:hypothetical protein
MKTIILELPDDAAEIFESMSARRKSAIALLTASITKATLPNLDNLLESIDKKVVKSDLTEEEIDKLLEELS